MNSEERSNEERAADWERQADEHYADLIAARSELSDVESALAAGLARIAAVEATLREFVNVRGDFYEPNPLAAMIERLAAAVDVELRSDWRSFVAVLAASPTPTGPETCEHNRTEAHLYRSHNQVGGGMGVLDHCRGPATPEPTEETP